MIYFFLSYLTLVFLFVFPFNLKAGSYFVMRYKKGGGFLELGLYRLSFSIVANEGGIEVKGIKKHDYKYKIVEEDIKKHKGEKKIIPISKQLLRQLYIDRLHLVMRYGNKDNAYNTSMVLISADLVSQTINNIFYDKIKSYKKILIPEYNKDTLYIDFKISLKVNLILIFSILFKIIITNVTNKIREIIYEFN